MSKELGIGRIVHYTLNDLDATRIAELRANQLAIGNVAEAGQTYPMIITRVWPDSHVNGQVFLDGNDVLWVTSRCEGEGPGFFRRPVIS